MLGGAPGAIVGGSEVKCAMACRIETGGVSSACTFLAECTALKLLVGRSKWTDPPRVLSASDGGGLTLLVRACDICLRFLEDVELVRPTPDVPLWLRRFSPYHGLS